MPDVICPHCGAVLEAKRRHLGEVVICAFCGKSFDCMVAESDPSEAVIDVKAEPVGEKTAPETQTRELMTSASTPFREEAPPFYYEERIYTGGGILPRPGCCCGTGCLMFLLLAALAFKGLISLF